MHPRRLLAACLLATAVAATLRAQERDTTRATTRDTTRGHAVRLSPIVVTGAAVPLRARDVGFAFTVIEAGELSTTRPLYAADVLRDQPGAFIDEAAGPGGPTIVRLRGGEEVFTQILMDGVQVNQEGGFFDFLGFPLTNVERIEIARGPQSALYGSSAVSGVVQLITRRGEPGPPRVTFATEGGGSTEHGGTFRGNATASGGSESLRYSLGGGASYSRGIYALPHDTWTRDASLRLDATPGPRWDLSGTFRWVDVETKLPVRDPGATRVPLDPNARDDRDRFVASAGASLRATPSWTHSLTTSLYHEAFLFEDQFDDVASMGPFPFFVFDASFRFIADFSRYTADYVGSHRLAPGGALDALTVTYGARFEREDLAQRITGDFEDNISFGRNSGALFGEVQAALARRVSLLAGVRLERFEGLPAEVTPRVSAVVEAVPDVVFLRGAAGRAYKAPNLQEQFVDNPFIASNPDLEPETSTSWELGAEVRPANGTVSIAAAYFRQQYRNLIRTVADEASSKQINRNLGAARAQGVEWAVRLRGADTWAVGADGAWIVTDVLDNAGLSPAAFPLDSVLPFRPAVTAGAFIEVRPSGRVTARLRVRAIGSQVVLSERFSGSREHISPYAILGLNLDVGASARLGFYARLDNLFDTTYQTAFDRRGIPRTVAVGVRVHN